MAVIGNAPTDKLLTASDIDPSFVLPIASGGTGQITGYRADLSLLGAVPGFNYSVLGGTAEQPAELYYKRNTEWIKVVLTWGVAGGETGNVTKSAYYYSSNSGGAYSNMIDSNNNYVQTFAYDVNANITTTTWGSTP